MISILSLSLSHSIKSNKRHFIDMEINIIMAKVVHINKRIWCVANAWYQEAGVATAQLPDKPTLD